MPKLDPEEVVRAVGRRIAEVRRASGMTQQELAGELDVATQWVSRVEQGAENLTLVSLARLANGLGVGLVDLLQPPTSRASTSKPGRPRKAR